MHKLVLLKRKAFITKKTLGRLRFWMLVYRSIGIAFIGIGLWYRNSSYIYYAVGAFFVSFAVFFVMDKQAGRHKAWIRKKRLDEWKKKQSEQSTLQSESKGQQETQERSG